MQKLIPVACPGCGSQEIRDDLVCLSCGSRLAWSQDGHSLRLAGVNHQCPGCGRMNDKNNRFCGICGEPLVLACPVCAGEHPQDTRVCPVHGVRLLGFQRAVARLREFAVNMQVAEARLECFQKAEALTQEIARLEAGQAGGSTQKADSEALPGLVVLYALAAWFLAFVLAVVLANLSEALYYSDYSHGMPQMHRDALIGKLTVGGGVFGTVLAFLLAWHQSNVSSSNEEAAHEESVNRLRDCREKLSRIRVHPDAVALHRQCRKELDAALSACAQEVHKDAFDLLKERAGIGLQ